ncbi:MAG: MgtC/SapB family protein [Tissierellia bacterium]|nr:MgtC/SapB family protein [Tissierellia bacterium]
MISNLEIVFRLALSAIIGGMIGIEREVSNRPAGFRTHILVTIGSALIMLISTTGFPGMEARSDPARLAAQVVSGIGFLGAGTILRTGNNIKGLTTAASLWVCGGIGLAIGSGYYLGGIMTGAIAFMTLIHLGAVDRRIIRRKYKVAVVKCHERPGLVGDLGQAFGSHKIIIKDIRISRTDEEDFTDVDDEWEFGTVEMEFVLSLTRDFNYATFNQIILQIDGVEEIKWED